MTPRSKYKTHSVSYQIIALRIGYRWLENAYETICHRKLSPVMFIACMYIYLSIGAFQLDTYMTIISLGVRKSVYHKACSIYKIVCEI